jgi:hypothetical protein
VIVNVKELEAWNLANAKARQAYRRQEGLETLPGSLVPGPIGTRGWPIRGWLLDALVECEMAERRAEVAELVAQMAQRELGVALLQIERLTRGEERAPDL